MRRISGLALVCLSLLITAPAGSGQGGTEPQFDPIGLQPKRGYFAQLPFESVDMVNGNLLLTFTDLVLPGNAGMDLRVQRTFNKQVTPNWRFGLAGVPMEVTNPEAPWPEGTGESRIRPSLRTADGTEHPTTPVNGLESIDVWITEQFWRYTLATRTVELPNGWTASYSDDPGRALLEEVEDPFGNRISVEWDSFDPQDMTVRRPLRFFQTVGGETREVSFTYETSWATLPKTMTFAGRTWVYDYTYDPWQLVAVQPPAGQSWGFDYADGLRVTTPAGGHVRYVFEGQAFPDDGGSTRQVVRQRTIGGRDVPPGTWSFTYSPQDGNQIGSYGTVQAPDGRQVEFKHEWAALGGRWMITRKRVLDGSNEVARMERQYKYLSIVPWATSLGTVPVPEVETIAQDGQTYSTHYSYRPNDAANHFGDYHKPSVITESQSGYPARTITREFDYDFGSLYLLHRTRSETVSVGGESFTVSYEYENGTGFLEQQTTYGITDAFSRDEFGNRASARDANGNTTYFTYQRGVLEDTATPEYTIDRSINFDGTVASERRGGLTTHFEYDGLGRVERVAPPGADPTTTDYFSDRLTVSRGSSFTTTFIDGFGRPTGTVDAAGVGTAIAYDADGRKVFQSYPFGGTEGSPTHGDHFDYDALGRVTRVTHPDGSALTYDYDDGSVEIRDEENRITTQRWQAFGDPGDARLIALVDARGREWRYLYNALGNLTEVVAPDGSQRRWRYDGQNRLREEIHPESGTTQYSYDNVGNLFRKVDAVREIFYGYDDNNRLTAISTPDGADNVTIEYDDFDNRTLLATNLVRSELTYPNNRLELRRDVIGGHTFATRYGYDTRDNLTRIDYPSGRYVIYDYDNADRIIRVRGSNGQGGEQIFADAIAYHPTGAIKSYTFGNSAHESVAFDGRFRPERIVSGPLDLAYGYDFVGNVRSLTDPRPGLSSGFTYDSLDRLEDVTGFGERSFTYDDHGNRLSKSAGGVQYFYDGRLRLTSITGGAEAGQVSHDNVGNMTGDPSGGVYTYTHLNMLATATVGGSTSSYGYDGDNLRKYRSTPDGVFYYVHGQASQLLAEYDVTSGQPEVMREYIYLGTRLLASVGRGNVPEPPISVRLTNPRSGDRFPNDELLALQADAAVTIPDETIARVEFYYNGVLIGSDTTAPYTFDWVPNLPQGEYTLLARVVTSSGQAAVSSPVSIRFFLVGRVTGLTVTPTSPAAGQAATITVTGNMNICGAVGLDFGDGESLVLPYDQALGVQPFTWTHTWMTGGPKTVVATGHGNCRGSASTNITISGPNATITAPAAGTTYLAPATIPIEVSAVDTGGGTIARVEFYAGEMLLGEDSSAPYTLTWNGVGFGTHTLTAKAINTAGITGISALVQIEVVNLSGVTVSPSTVGTNTPATITVTGSNPCGLLQIDYGDGNAPYTPISQLPYTTAYAWATGGTKTVVVTAGANCGGRVSTTVNVVANAPPAVTLTSPANGAGYIPPATISLQATASDSDGSIDRVEFYAGTQLVGTASAAPFATTWSVAADGTYTVTAQAIDNLGARTVSNAATITVSQVVTGVSLSPASVVTGQLATATVTGSSTCGAVELNFGADATTGTQVYPITGLPISRASAWTTAGTKTVVAIGHGGCGGQASATIAVNPNPAPTVAMTAPANGSAYTAGTVVTLSATATDGHGVARVEFYAGSTLLGDDTTAPYSFAWSVPAGTHSITARAIDIYGGAATSAAITIGAQDVVSVSVSPSSLNAGDAGAVTVHGSSVCGAVTIDYGDGTVITYAITGLPITRSHIWTAGGQKTVTARGESTCIGQASTSVTVNWPPSVSLTAPVSGNTYVGPASIGLAASASDPDGSITQVRFFANGGLLTTDYAAPYSFNWTNVPVGTYTLTASATDNRGVTRTSAAAVVTVQDPGPSRVTSVVVSPATIGVGQYATITVYGTSPCGLVEIRFGDGYYQHYPTETLPHTAWHAWSAPGTYTVTALGHGNCSGQASTTVTVTGAPDDPLDTFDLPGAFDLPEVLSSSLDLSSVSADPEAVDAVSPGPVDWVDEAPAAGEEAFTPSSGPFAYPEDTRAATGLQDDVVVPDYSTADDSAVQSTVTLTVTLTGTGSGAVSGPGIGCSGGLGATCSGTFSSGTVVTLTPSADAGSAFKGWGGACAGTGACTVTLSQSLLVVATFGVPPPMVTQYYHLDAIGSVRAVTDQAGALVRRHDYAAFGEDMLLDEPQPLPASAKQQRFTGKERDTETFLDYFGARYYRSMWGRFTNVDPGHVNGNVLDPQSWNAYAYARNNPFRFVDPTGTEYQVNWANDGSWSTSYVSDDEWHRALSDLGWGFEVQGNNILAWRDGRWVIAAYFQWQPDQPRTFDALVQQTGDLAQRWLKESLTDMAVSTAFAAGGGLVAGLRGGYAAVSSAPTAGALAPRFTLSRHALQRMAERGFTRRMVDLTLKRGTRYWDPKNGTVNYVLRHGFVSGRHSIVAVNPLTNVVTTVIRTGSVPVRLVPF